MATTPTVNYGNQGDGIGKKQQAFINRTALEVIGQKTIFDKFATIIAKLPEKESNVIKFRKYIPIKDYVFSNNVNRTLMGLGTTEADGAAAIATDVPYAQALINVEEKGYEDFILPEGGHNDSKAKFKIVEQEATVIPIGDWLGYSEELKNFSDMFNLAEIAKQFGEAAQLVIDGFYRDLYKFAAGNVVDIASADKKISDPDFKKALMSITQNLQLAGAKPLNSILSASAKFGTVPVKAQYTGVIHTLAENDLRLNNPDFKPVETYASNVKVLDDEIGILGSVRLIASPNAAIKVLDDSTVQYDVIVLSDEHTAQIPFKGKNRINIIVRDLEKDGGPLNRSGTIGWKAILGAKVLYPERIGVISVKGNRL